VTVAGQHISILLILIGAIAVCAIAAGCALAFSGYSSAGPFAIASACVGVLGTIAAQRQQQANGQQGEP